MATDPSESIIKECQITFSQEEKLRKCGFAFEPEEEETSPPFPVRVTGITMVSPPEINAANVEEDIFHTPPEHHRYRSMSSSDDQGPEIRPGNTQVVRRSEGDDCVEDVICDHDVSKVEFDLKKKKVDPQFTSQNVCLDDTETIVIESEIDDIVETEVVELADEENCVEMGERVSEETEKGASFGGRLGSKSIEDLDAYKYVSSGGVGKRGGRKGVYVRRELPNSFMEREENEVLRVPRGFLNDNETFKDLVDAAGMVIGDITDTNYIKTAKECGFTFYQPRWWPREGFDDHVMD